MDEVSESPPFDIEFCNGAYECSACGEQFVNQIDLWEHALEDHGQD